MRLLDACMQSLLVYGNDSVRLRDMICTDASLLRIMCTIALAARDGSRTCEADKERGAGNGGGRLATLGNCAHSPCVGRERVGVAALSNRCRGACSTRIDDGCADRPCIIGPPHSAPSTPIHKPHEAHETHTRNDPSRCGRRVDAEVARLRRRWQRGGVPEALARSLTECYLVEFLLDVALPLPSAPRATKGCNSRSPR